MARKPKIPTETAEMVRKLLAMPPKRHDEMKLGRAKGQSVESEQKAKKKGRPHG